MPTNYELISGRIIDALKGGIIPWRKPWKASAHGSAFPHNRLTGKSYRGINAVSLMCSPYSSNAWLTYKQAQELGAQVRKGEKSSPVVYWNFDNVRGRKSGDTGDTGDTAESLERGAPFMKLYHVFNVEQVDGLQDALPFDAPTFQPIDAAERIVEGYLSSASHPSLAHGGDRAYYVPLVDRVQMPLPGSFVSPAAYYCTLFHELGHSTGHRSRLARKIENHFGDRDYSDEELCAEFTAAFLSAEAQISNDALIENSTAYIQSWIAKLMHDPKVAVWAAQRAQKAADYILGRTVAEVAA